MPCFISTISRCVETLFISIRPYSNCSYNADASLALWHASVYNSSWIATLLFFLFFNGSMTLYALPSGVATVLGLSILIETARKLGEHLFNLPDFFRTGSHPKMRISSALILAIFFATSLFTAIFGTPFWGFFFLFEMRFVKYVMFMTIGVFVTVDPLFISVFMYCLLRRIGNKSYEGDVYALFAKADLDTLPPFASITCKLSGRSGGTIDHPVRLHGCGDIFEREVFIAWMMAPAPQIRRCPRCKALIKKREEVALQLSQNA